jgi:hypothetical protein
LTGSAGLGRQGQEFGIDGWPCEAAKARGIWSSRLHYAYGVSSGVVEAADSVERM